MSESVKAKYLDCKNRLKFAERCNILMKTPQYKEMKSFANNALANYQDAILTLGNKPLDRDMYLLLLGRYQGVSLFIETIENEAKYRERYDEQLKRLKKELL